MSHPRPIPGSRGEARERCQCNHRRDRHTVSGLATAPNTHGRLTACTALVPWSHRYCQCDGFTPKEDDQP